MSVGKFKCKASGGEIIKIDDDSAGGCDYIFLIPLVLMLLLDLVWAPADLRGCC